MESIAARGELERMLESALELADATDEALVALHIAQALDLLRGEPATSH